MEQLKIAALKLVTGEEIICTLIEMVSEGSYTTVVIKDPAKVERRDRRKRNSYSLNNWLIFGNEGYHDIEVSRIITVNQITELDVLDRYHSFFRKKITAPKPRATKNIGFIGNTKDYKEILERLYKYTDSYEKPKDI